MLDGVDGPRRTSISGPLRAGARTLVDIGRTTYVSWYQDRAIRLGAGLAYYALFAILPILSLAVFFASLFVSRADVEAALDDALGELLGTASASVSGQVAEELDRTVVRSGLGVVGAVSMVIAATLLFVALQDAFNTIWSVPLERGVRTTLRRRLISFVVVLLLAGYLVTAVIISTTTDVLAALTPGSSRFVEQLSPLLETSTSWAAGVGSLALILKLLAPVPLAWRHVLIGGGVTAVLVVIGTQLLGIYLSRVATASLSGAAGAIGLFLVWLYYEAQIILVGAELTRTLSERSAPRENTPSEEVGEVGSPPC